MSAGAARRAAITGVLAGLLVGGCAADPAAPASTTAAPAQTAAPAPIPSAAPGGGGSGREDGGRGRGGGSGGGSGGRAAGVTLPADFPAEVPLPPGTLEASSGAAGRWSAQLLVPGSASAALTSAMQFYLAHGFTADSPATAHRDRYAVTLVTENRDHSPTSTHLVVGVVAR